MVRKDAWQAGDRTLRKHSGVLVTTTLLVAALLASLGEIDPATTQLDWVQTWKPTA